MKLLIEATSRAEQRHFWFRGFRRFVRPLLARACCGVSTPVLLDCGCGTGANVDWLGAFGRTYGCDLTWTGLAYAQRAGRRTVVQASADHLPYSAAAFDVVTSFDLLYALPDDAEREALREMYRVLRPGGCLIVNDAALDVLHGDHAVLDREVRRYTRKRLAERLRAAGFTIERLTYTNATLLPLLIPLRSYQRWRGLAPEEDAGWEIRVPPAPVNTLLGAALAVEAAVVRWVNMPIGSSILALARKPATPTSPDQTSTATG